MPEQEGSNRAGHTLEDWISILQTYGPAFGVIPYKYELKSPQFLVGGWRVALEHQRQFKFAVIRKAPDARSTPAVPSSWEHCPPSDRQEGWEYRTKLRPDGV